MTQDHRRLYREFLAKLKKSREEANLTQVEVAQSLGKPQSYVSKCESGERRVDIVELQKFAALYGKPITFFQVNLSRLSRTSRKPARSTKASFGTRRRFRG